jgi:hypothetical protein
MAVVILRLRFELPGLPDTTDRLEIATLRLFLDDVVCSPAAGASVYQSVADNDIVPSLSDYEDAMLAALCWPGLLGRALRRGRVV